MNVPRNAAAVLMTVLAVGCGFSFGADDIDGTDNATPIRVPDRRNNDVDDAGGTTNPPPSADASSASDGAVVDAAPVGPLKAFVSSTLTTGNIGGVAGADALCNTAATAANLPGKYTAWISTTTTNAIDRITANGPWQLVNGTVILPSKADLTKGSLAQRFDKDEKGQTPPLNEDRVWTGTGVDGKFASADCAAWAGTGGEGRVGEAERTNGGWTSLEKENCTEVNRVYCLQQ